MKRRLLTIVAGLSVLAACCPCEEKFTQYVDTHIGTGGHGHVFVGANVPFGAVQLGPTSIPQSWDWCSGYHDSDSTVIGFSHTHLSGTGIGDLFDITVMPVTGKVNYARGTEDDQNSGLWSYADRSKEISVPGYYSVPLMRYGITAEMTATCRTGMHRYTFPASEEAAIVFDMVNGGCWDAPADTDITVVDMKEDGSASAIQGYRWSKGWANNQKLYFYAEFSKPFDSIDIISGSSKKADGSTWEVDMYARANFCTEEGEQILMKVAISPVSEDNAKANLMAENPEWDFEAIAEAADKAWNAELSKVRIETADEDAKKVFYTALYHTMIAPSVFCDVNGDYRGADDKIYRNADFTNYTTFSLWDTYRAAMPLMTIIHPEKENDMINTMLHIFEQQGKLPVWHLMGCETDCMVGNPGIPVVADAILKGYDGFDKDLAFKAMMESAIRPDRGQDFRMQYGYIPSDKFHESVAYDMEYAIADGALAKAAKVLMKSGYDYFLKRSHSYRHYFDPQTRFMRGKDSNGEFDSPFDPLASAHRANVYCEGNAWQYTWLAPHDLDGLAECFGGRDELISKLDSLFIVSSELGEDASPDISGLIGQYAHGNEPSHHILYFYTMLDQPWKTADKVRQVLSELYFAKPDGLSGNEDVGQMSAWYILSALGFYQVEPAGGEYWFGSPIFDKAEIKVAGGTFTIRTEDNSDSNRYIQSITLNGAPYNKGYICHEDIAAGGELVINMGSEPVIWY